MEENTEQRVDLTLFSEKIQELKDRIACVLSDNAHLQCRFKYYILTAKTNPI